jgi:putative membrane protein
MRNRPSGTRLIPSSQGRKLPLPYYALLAVLVVNATSIFGYCVFTCHPQLLARWPWAASIFGVSYPIFARLQIALAFVAMCAALARWAGWRWLPSCVLICAISATAELMGTTYGLPFGRYEYTALLGPKIADRVPYLIPLSWFFMSIASYAIADRVGARPGAQRLVRALGGAGLLSAWDLTLDPAMSRLAPFWIWSDSGAYFGTPLENLFGWFLTGACIMTTLEWLRAYRWTRRIPAMFSTTFYAINLSLPLGIVIGSGMWAPVGITALTLGLLAVAGYGLRPRAARLPGRPAET